MFSRNSRIFAGVLALSIALAPVPSYAGFGKKRGDQCESWLQRHSRYSLRTAMIAMLTASIALRHGVEWWKGSDWRLEGQVSAMKTEAEEKGLGHLNLYKAAGLHVTPEKVHEKVHEVDALGIPYTEYWGDALRSDDVQFDPATDDLNDAFARTGDTPNGGNEGEWTWAIWNRIKESKARKDDLSRISKLVKDDLVRAGVDKVTFVADGNGSTVRSLDPKRLIVVLSSHLQPRPNDKFNWFASAGPVIVVDTEGTFFYRLYCEKTVYFFEQGPDGFSFRSKPHDPPLILRAAEIVVEKKNADKFNKGYLKAYVRDSGE